jgi:outer membrane protein OmpA-like peptidoglycan-associated protein
MTSFLDEATSLITPDLISKAAAAFGVPSAGVQSAVSAAVPTVLGSIAAKCGDSVFINELFQMVTSGAASAPAGASAASVIDSINAGSSSPMLEMSRKLLGGLFGGAGDSVTSAIGRMAGASVTGSGILGTVGALAISMLGNRVSTGGLSPAALAGSLLGERNALMAAIPAPIAALLGSSRSTSAPAAAGVSRGRGTATSPDNPFVAFAMVTGLALIGWYFVHTSKPDAPPPPPVVVAPAPVLPPGLELLKLPNGVELQVAPTGIEGQLVAFIQDSTKPVDKTTWFDFDRLLFETGSATLLPASSEQLHNIAEILKAFPKVSLKLGGYTDNVGKASANMTLSGDRANTAMAELVKLGIDSTRLAAEGYGDTVPVADNATEEGRAKNRRTAARVTAK